VKQTRVRAGPNCLIRTFLSLLLAVLATALLLGGAQLATDTARAAGRLPADIRVAPEFPHTRQAQWLNSRPLTLAELRGKVLLLDVWTTDCWNCYRSFPWLKQLDNRFAGRGLLIIGVHSPEFEREKDRAGIAARLAQYQLTNPQMLDDDFTYWKQLGNRFWPAFYLIDRQGRIRELLVGETHAGGGSALAFEARIEAILAEPG
jgi:thiol-disulfide isomerase/thioredoxin